MKVFVAGHKGMVGSAICRRLANTSAEIITASRSELDLMSQIDVKKYFNEHKFDQVYLAAARVGGVHANNSFPAEFIYQNLVIQNNVIHESFISGVHKLLFLGSSCIYPRLAEQPMAEKELLKGYLELTNEPYAIAKIAGIKMCESYNRQYNVDYRSLMPTNLYGPGDNYHSKNSHVIPALISRFHEAVIKKDSKVSAWGTGSPLREFLHVDDMAAAAVYVMNLGQDAYGINMNPRMSHLNVGSGQEYSIKQLTELIADIVGFSGQIVWDTGMPDGAPRKLMDSSRIFDLGWRPKYSLENGLKDSYTWFVDNYNVVRR